MANWEFNLRSKKLDLPEPLGYSSRYSQEAAVNERQQQQDMRDLIEKKVFQFSIANASSIIMAVVMFFFMGNSLHIFTIIFIFQFLMQPIRTLLNMNAAFKQFEGKKISLFKYKIMYAGVQLIILFIGLYKLSSIGLLPFLPSDWVDLIPPYQQKEIAINML